MASESKAILPIARYSSASQRADHRYQAWREGSLLSFGQLFDTTPLMPFEVETVSAQLGSIGFSHTHMSAQNWSRTPDIVRSDDLDPLMVNIRFQGVGRGDADGHAFEAPGGTIGLCDFARPQSYFSEACFTAVLAIPRALAEERLPPVRSLHGLVIQREAATLLRTHALALAKALDAGLPARQAAGLGQMALDLLEVGIAQSMANGSVSPASAATAVRLAAEAAIDRSLASASLTVDNLCRWTGVSRATLYRVFDADGGIRAFIRRRRLERIAEDLRKGRREPLEEIAERWGFVEVSHMSRVFRQMFGQAPGDYRAWHATLAAELHANG